MAALPIQGPSLNFPSAQHGELTEIDLKLEIRRLEEQGNLRKAIELCEKSYFLLSSQGQSDRAEILSADLERLKQKVLQDGSSRLLFDEHFQPRAQLLELLKATGYCPLAASIDEINSWAQKNLLRQGERWQEQSERFEALKPTIRPLLKDLQFMNHAHPLFSEYEGAIVHGALLPRVRLRLHTLVEAWKKGIRFSDLYFFTGERPLEPVHENEWALTHDEGSLIKIMPGWKPPVGLPQTESEMTRWVWDQSEVPEEMRTINVHFISAPMKLDPKTGKSVRPTTDDTVMTWLSHYPAPGRYLAASNAPYTNRQDLVMRTLAPHEYGFDTIGLGASEDENTAIFLDELARLIFQTKQLSDKHR